MVYFDYLPKKGSVLSISKCECGENWRDVTKVNN